MSVTLNSVLAGVEIAKALTVSNLQVFGIRQNRASTPLYITLDDALASKVVQIKEIDEGGSVPELKVVNSGEKMVFLLVGEMLVGAKQNRILNISIMVAPRSEVTIPVSCVEQGRWGYVSPEFSASAASSPSSLRFGLSQTVSSSYRTLGAPVSDQGKIWKEVRGKLRRMGSTSASESLDQVFTDYQEDLDQMISKVKLEDDCNGAVFVRGGKVVGLDLFDQPATLSKLFPKLLRSYAIDALENSEKVDVVDTAAVRAWLSSAAQVKGERYKSVGLGDDIRFEGKDLVGGSLFVEEQAVHTEVLAAPRA